MLISDAASMAQRTEESLAAATNGLRYVVMLHLY